MKKKKEFFRIRKDRKRKNGANARACVYVYKDRTARDRLPLFRQKRRSPTDREEPLTGFSSRPEFSFLNNDGKPEFCFRVSEPTLFCFLNLPANGKARAEPEALTRARVYVHSPPPTSENSQERRACPFQALQGTYKAFYGRDR